MAHNFLKRSQGKMGKPRYSVELKKLNYIIRLFSGLSEGRVVRVKMCLRVEECVGVKVCVRREEQKGKIRG